MFDVEFFCWYVKVFLEYRPRFKHFDVLVLISSIILG